MNSFTLHILGCGSATPTTLHWPSCQILELRGKQYMIDCGEGCQFNMRKSRLNFARLRAIFISHLHGDHCFGLPGLLSTMGLLGRTGTLQIYGPEGIEEYIRTYLQLFGLYQPFEIEVHTVDTTRHTCIYSDPSLAVYTLPLRHRIPTCGYLFEEKCAARHLNKPSCDFYQIPVRAYKSILEGVDYTLDTGEIIPNERLTTPGRPPKRYAYCSDTRFFPELAELVRGVDLLYHEATFMNAEKSRAEETNHSTAAEAAQLARLAGVRELLIGHYSARYLSSKELLAEAQAIFPDTRAAHEQQVITF